MLILDGEHPASTLAFTPDGKQLITVRWDGGSLDVWTLATGKCKKLASSTGAGFSGPPAVHRSGKTVFAAGARLRCVSLEGEKLRSVTTSRVREVVVSPDGEWVIAATGSLTGYRCKPDGTLQDPPAWKVRSHLVQEMPGGFLGTGEQFVTVDHGALVIRDTKTGAVKSTVPFPSDSVGYRAVSPDGSRFAAVDSTYARETLYLWETATWANPKQIKCNRQRFVSFAFHPTQPVLATIQEGASLVQYLDTNSGKFIAKFEWRLGDLWSVAFSPDGTLAAASSASTKIVVWDVDA